MLSSRNISIRKIVQNNSALKECTKVTKKNYAKKNDVWDDPILKKDVVMKDLPQVPTEKIAPVDELTEVFNEKLRKNEPIPQPTTLEGRFAAYKTTLLQLSSMENVKKFEDFVNGLTEEQKNYMNEYHEKSDKIQQEIADTYGHVNMDKFKARSNALLLDFWSPPPPTVTVAVSGAAGQIAYSLLFRIASGGMFGEKTRVNIRLLDIPVAEQKLEGVKMELEDCAFPLVNSITTAVDPEKGFEGADWVLLVGGTPRSKGMERKDLLLKNAEVFASQGRALENVGKRDDTRVLVVGNPANTNAWIASKNAPSIPAENFAAMTRLDHNRGVSLLGEKLNVPLSNINKFVIWGNHSATQFPDISHATVNGKLVSDLVDKKWLTDTFIPTVQQRGAAVIAARGASSAASAANAVVDNVRDWYLGTKSSWTTVAVPSQGEYGVTPGLFYSYPVVYENQKYAVVNQLPIDEFAAQRMEATHQELLQELEIVSSLKN